MAIRFEKGAFTTMDLQPLSLAEATAWSDFARANHIPNLPPDQLLQDNASRLLVQVTKMYEILGTWGIVTSVYRCPVLNARVGGKVQPPSAHMELRAIDSVPYGKDLHQCFEILRLHTKELGYDQLIIEHDHAGHQWIHISVPKLGVKPRYMAFALEKAFTTDRRVSG